MCTKPRAMCGIQVQVVSLFICMNIICSTSCMHYMCACSIGPENNWVVNFALTRCTLDALSWEETPFRRSDAVVCVWEQTRNGAFYMCSMREFVDACVWCAVCMAWLYRYICKDAQSAIIQSAHGRFSLSCCFSEDKIHRARRERTRGRPGRL